jgi:hypothetical protein
MTLEVVLQTWQKLICGKCYAMGPSAKLLTDLQNNAVPEAGADVNNNTNPCFASSSDSSE